MPACPDVRHVGHGLVPQGQGRLVPQGQGRLALLVALSVRLDDLIEENAAFSPGSGNKVHAVVVVVVGQSGTISGRRVDTVGATHCARLSDDAHFRGRQGHQRQDQGQDLEESILIISRRRKCTKGHFYLQIARFLKSPLFFLKIAHLTFPKRFHSAFVNNMNDALLSKE